MTSDLEKKLGPIFSEFADADADRVRDTFKQLHLDGKLVYNGGEYFTNMREEEQGWTGDPINSTKAAEILMSAYNFDPSTAPTDPGVESQSTDTTQTTTGPVPAVETTTTGDDNMTDTTTPRATPVTPVEEDDRGNNPFTMDDMERVYDHVVGRLTDGAKSAAIKTGKAAVALGSVGAVTAAHYSGLADVSEYGLEAVTAATLALGVKSVANSRGWGRVTKSAAELAAAGIGFAGAESAFKVGKFVASKGYSTVSTGIESVINFPGYAAAAGVTGAALASAVAFPKARKPIVGTLAAAGLIALCAGYGGDAVDAGSNAFSSAKEYIAGLFAEQADEKIDLRADARREFAAASEDGKIEAAIISYGKQLAVDPNSPYQTTAGIDTVAIDLNPCLPEEAYAPLIGAEPQGPQRAVEEYHAAKGNLQSYIVGLLGDNISGTEPCHIEIGNLSAVELDGYKSE